MTTKSETFLSNLLRKRADYRLGKTRKQRQQQYQQQTLALIVVLVATVIAGLIFMYVNYNGTGVANAANCENYPQYCVPFAGGATGSNQIEANEANGARELDKATTAEDSVVRGITTDTHRPFIGNPNAPIHFWLVADFACPHCQDYHEGDFSALLRNFVLTGQATIEYSAYPTTGGYSGLKAMQAALCAGEQGAFWEYSDEMYRLATSLSPERAFSTSRLTQAAEEMGLNDGALRSCLNSNRYGPWVTSEYTVQAQDYGVSGTPTVFVSYGTSGDWQKVGNPAYSFLANLAQTANAGN